MYKKNQHFTFHHYWRVFCQGAFVLFPIVIYSGLFQEKISGGVETPSIIWGTTTRILIIFGVPPHKYKYLK